MPAKKKPAIALTPQGSILGDIIKSAGKAAAKKVRPMHPKPSVRPVKPAYAKRKPNKDGHSYHFEPYVAPSHPKPKARVRPTHPKPKGK